MAFFEDLGKTISDTSKEVATKAKALTEAISLKTQISSEKAKLNDVYKSIGKKYYESHPEAEDEVYVMEYDLIKAGLAKIAVLEEELCQTEGARICAECGAKVPKDSAFCGRCGAAVCAPASGESTEVAVKESFEMQPEEEAVYEVEATPSEIPEAEEATELSKTAEVTETADSQIK